MGDTKAKVVKYNDNDRKVTALLKENENGLTLAEINEALGTDYKPGTITAIVKKDLIEPIGTKEVTRPAKSKVGAYAFVTDEVTKKADGKDNVYSASETAILGVLKNAEKPMTLADVAVALNVEKLTSGNINGLVGKGNVAKVADVEVIRPSKHEVNVYGFVADVPEA